MTIADLQPGHRGTINQVEARGVVLTRLLAMGLLPDTTITLQRVAPTGDPLWVRVLGTQVALRRKEARLVHITAAES